MAVRHALPLFALPCIKYYTAKPPGMQEIFLRGRVFFDISAAALCKTARPVEKGGLFCAYALFLRHIQFRRHTVPAIGKLERIHGAVADTL